LDEQLLLNPEQPPDPLAMALLLGAAAEGEQDERGRLGV